MGSVSAEWDTHTGRFVHECLGDVAEAWADTRAGQALCNLACPLADIARLIALVEAGDASIEGLHDRIAKHQERVNAALEALYEAPDRYVEERSS